MITKYKQIIGISLCALMGLNALHAEILQTSVSIGVNSPKSVSQNTSANVSVGSYDITPYGEFIDANTFVPFKSTRLLNIDTNPFIYGQSYFDNESGFNYMKARYQNPRLMRFISQDSEDLKNRYAYGNGDPINNFDPSGHNALNLIIGSFLTAIGITMALFSGGSSLMLTAGIISPSISIAGNIIEQIDPIISPKIDNKILTIIQATSVGLDILIGAVVVSKALSPKELVDLLGKDGDIKDVEDLNNTLFLCGRGNLNSHKMLVHLKVDDEVLKMESFHLGTIDESSDIKQLIKSEKEYKIEDFDVDRFMKRVYAWRKNIDLDDVNKWYNDTNNALIVTNYKYSSLTSKNCRYPLKVMLNFRRMYYDKSQKIMETLRKNGQLIEDKAPSVL